MSLQLSQYCVFAKIILLITQEIANVNNCATLLTKNNYLWFKAKGRFFRLLSRSVDIFAYHLFKLASDLKGIILVSELHWLSSVVVRHSPLYHQGPVAPCSQRQDANISSPKTQYMNTKRKQKEMCICCYTDKPRPYQSGMYNIRA